MIWCFTPSQETNREKQRQTDRQTDRQTEKCIGQWPKWVLTKMHGAMLVDIAHCAEVTLIDRSSPQLDRELGQQVWLHADPLHHAIALRYRGTQKLNVPPCAGYSKLANVLSFQTWSTLLLFVLCFVLKGFSHK